MVKESEVIFILSFISIFYLFIGAFRGFFAHYETWSSIRANWLKNAAERPYKLKMDRWVSRLSLPFYLLLWASIGFFITFVISSYIIVKLLDPEGPMALPLLTTYAIGVIVGVFRGLSAYHELWPANHTWLNEQVLRRPDLYGLMRVVITISRVVYALWWAVFGLVIAVIVYGIFTKWFLSSDPSWWSTICGIIGGVINVDEGRRKHSMYWLRHKDYLIYLKTRWPSLATLIQFILDHAQLIYIMSYVVFGAVVCTYLPYAFFK